MNWLRVIWWGAWTVFYGTQFLSVDNLWWRIMLVIFGTASMTLVLFEWHDLWAKNEKDELK